MLNFADSLQNNIFHTISNVCSKMNIKAFIIGGYVRDLVISRSSKDVDIVVIGSGILVAKQVAAEFGSGTQVKYFKKLWYSYDTKK